MNANSVRVIIIDGSYQYSLSAAAISRRWMPPQLGPATWHVIDPADAPPVVREVHEVLARHA